MMMKRICLLIAGVIFFYSGFTQTTITQWNFNTSVLTPSTGSATDTLKAIGGITYSFSGAAGSSDPSGGNLGLSTTNYPASTFDPGTAGIQFDVSTFGYKDIKINFDYKNDALAANTFIIRYSIDGINYFDFTTIVASTTAFNNNITVDLSAVAGLNNNPKVSFKIVTTFDGVSGDYKSTASVSPYSNAVPVLFDMVTVKGTALSCGGSPTIQASNLQIFETSSTSIRFSFDRGNGGGAMVVVKEASVVDGYPTFGTSYTANTVFGSGSQIGTGNYVVYSSTEPGTHVDTITGLTAGKKYYFAVFEYSSSGYCYLNPPTTLSASTSGTNLAPGDILIVGFDAVVTAAGTFRMCLLPLVDLKAGTTFSIVFSRFEAGAAANVRTNKWYSDQSDLYNDLTKYNFTVSTGYNIAAGSVISFTSTGGSVFSNILVNGSTFNGLQASSENGRAIPTTNPVQMFIVQGEFSGYGQSGPLVQNSANRYNLLSGRVIYGLSNQNNWTPFTSAVSVSTVNILKTSRLPQEINCIKNNFGSNVKVAYYNGPTYNGTRRQILSAVTNNLNWATTTSASTADEIGSIGSFTVSAGVSNGTWVGDGNSNWFDCTNWGSYYVSQPNTDVNIPASVLNNPVIDTNSVNARTFSGKAQANTLSITSGQTLTLNGAGTEKLYLWGNLSINNATGKLVFGGTSTNDTLFMYGNWNASASGNAAGTNFDPGNGTVAFYCNNSLQSINEAGSNTFYKLYMNNKFGLNVGTGGTKKISNQLNLNNGVITVATGTAFTLAGSSSLKSPVNNYGNTNEGYELSYIDGAASIEINATATKVLPIGGGGYFAPLKIQKANSNLVIYTGQYFAVPYIDTINVDPTLDHVSKKEYWILNSNVSSTDDDAYITLSWRPFSKVTNIVNYSDSILVAHYYNPGTGLKWYPEFNSLIANVTSGNANYGTVTSNKYVTSYSPFTLGSRSVNIILPFRLIRWEAVLNGGAIDLKWLIENDYEINHYELQRSINGVSFGTIASANSLNKPSKWNYSGNDPHPVNGWNYYRLKVISNSGEVMYSQVVKVKIGGPAILQVYPNPASREVSINITDLRSVSSIELVSIDGQIIKSLIPAGPLTKINVEFLSAGTYYFRFRTSDGIITRKFIKQ